MLTWRKEPPDCDGLWARRTVNGNVSFYSYDEFKNGVFAVGGEWCRIGDTPTIAEPVKYREPTMADVGRTVEVKNDGHSDWRQRTLIWIKAKGDPFVCLNNAHHVGVWPRARIVDDGRKPREGWVSPNAIWYAKENADEHGESIKVREVMG